MTRVLSLGWGVQSWTLAAMAALGDIPKVDVAIHADTLHERANTYLFAREWALWLDQRGVRVVTVSDRQQDGTADKWGGVFIPAFTHDGRSAGMLRRQCTERWKIRPMRRWLRENLPGHVDLLIGISTDEALRQKPSDVQYVTNTWPLIELGMSRADCVAYLKDRGLPVPTKSSCTFCPFHDTAEWRDVKSDPVDWNEAVSVDNALRNLRPPYPLFVHPSRTPLYSVDLRTAEEHGQLRLWDEECSGVCGV